MALIPYSFEQWEQLGRSLESHVRQHGPTTVSFAVVNGDSVTRCEARATCSDRGLVLEDGGTWKVWYDSSFFNRVADMHTPEVPHFEAQFLVPLLSAIKNVGWEQGVLAAQRDAFNREYAQASADFQQKWALLERQAAAEQHRTAAMAEQEELLRQRVVQFQQQCTAFEEYRNKAAQDLEQMHREVTAKQEMLTELMAKLKKETQDVPQTQPKMADRWVDPMEDSPLRQKTRPQVAKTTAFTHGAPTSTGGGGNLPPPPRATHFIDEEGEDNNGV
ncbi:helicase-like protein, partial [Trypanosoma theileri]